MKVTVKNSWTDIVSFFLHIRVRKAKFRKAASKQLTAGNMNKLAYAVHPPVQNFTVVSRRVETPTSATFRITPVENSARIAVFRAGQYLSLEAEIDGIMVSRPFSIASPPDESYRGNYYDITIRTKDDGFLAPWIIRNWKSGSPVQTSDPQGYFYYDNLRDSKNVVCLAGGSCATPFRSIIPDILKHESEVNVTLLYGISSPEEMLYAGEWAELATAHPKNFRFVPVCSEDSAEWAGENGFLTADLIRKYTPAAHEASFFICGPAAMHEFLNVELAGMNLRQRQVHRENFGGSARSGGAADRVTISVLVEGSGTELKVEADPTETVLTSLERAGLNPPALCRTGDCGWCRSQLLDGSVHIPEGSDQRRAGDRKFGYFHPCSSWPESDLVIRIPRNPKTT